MASNGHSRRLDQVASKLPSVRPSPEALGREMDRLIALYTAREAGEPAVGVIRPKWPYEVLTRWVDEILEEGSE